MKYIRTQNGIIETASLKNLSQEEKDILIEGIKQANTIPELCDEFVVIHKELNGSHTVHRYNGLGKSEYEAGNDVYGAIWTKGEHDEPILKSVAKMKGILPNGEIDWELL